MKNLVIRSLPGVSPSPEHRHESSVPSSFSVTLHTSPYGTLGAVNSALGCCYLGFHNNTDDAWAEFYQQYQSKLEIKRDSSIPPCLPNYINDPWHKPEHFVLIGTLFQLRVWYGLTQIPQHNEWSYSKLAQHLGQPTSVRAIASAVARNPLAWCIPCHRVVPKSGGTGQYRWGANIKSELISQQA
ncbi:methylated-DNA--[protein]-cysteine S-methyltransferase [Bermanella sp. R86510]|uniref:methylated-DNA--[protein]-cysteine S-methyltransferase n=1 Tax=unclassified Bermanella TaxID=2627862 RepID=UPI0037CAA062